MCVEINGTTSAIVFFIAVACVIALAVVKKRRSNKEFTFADFIDENYSKLVNVLGTVVNLLMVNINDYPDKETYERDIIRLTIEKLYTNCDEFGIDSTLLKMINKDTLANTLYDLLHREGVNVFVNNVPVEVIKNNANLYNTEVLEAVGVEATDDLINEIDHELKKFASEEVKNNTEFVIDDVMTTDEVVSESFDNNEENVAE